MKLINQNRTGVLPEHHSTRLLGATLHCCRLTIPAREALAQAGATISPAESPSIMVNGEWEASTASHWTVALGDRCPQGLVVTKEYGSHALCIRCDNEPEWPGGEHQDFWSQVDLTPCPTCGAALVWYEAGYVPGYRVCAGPQHHHWQAASRVG